MWSENPLEPNVVASFYGISLLGKYAGRGLANISPMADATTGRRPMHSGHSSGGNQGLSEPIPAFKPDMQDMAVIQRNAGKLATHGAILANP